MSWHELELCLLREQLDAASACLFGLGCAGVQEEVPEGELRSSWEPSSPPSQESSVTLRASFEDPDRALVEAGVQGLGPLSLAWRELPEVDWGEAWKAEHVPIQLSRRIQIAPPWDAPPGAILIEPGQGFGTGQHPSTRLVGAALDELAERVETLLDVGCGSGVLALAGARLGLEVRGVDTQASAIEEAKANAERNGLTADFSTTPLAAILRSADLVVANIHAEALVQLAPDLIRLASPYLVLGGILADREHLVRDAFAVLGPGERVQEGRWVRLTYSKGRHPEGQPTKRAT